LLNLLKKGELLNVILPWLSQMAEQLPIGMLGELLEGLMVLLKDETGQVSERQKTMIVEIY
jgi:hypothetical protein